MSLKAQLLAVAAATLVAVVLCVLGVAAIQGTSAVWLPVAAGLVSLPAGFGVVLYAHSRGLTTSSIMGMTALRLAATAVLTGAVLVIVPGLRVPAFLLSIAFVYWMNLTAETWCVLQGERAAKTK